MGYRIINEPMLIDGYKAKKYILIGEVATYFVVVTHHP